MTERASGQGCPHLTLKPWDRQSEQLLNSSDVASEFERGARPKRIIVSQLATYYFVDVLQKQLDSDERL